MAFLPFSVMTSVFEVKLHVPPVALTPIPEAAPTRFPYIKPASSAPVAVTTAAAPSTAAPVTPSPAPLAQVEEMIKKGH